MVGETPAEPVERGDETYDPRWFELLDRVEDRHFWFVARRRVVAALARSAVAGAAPGYRVLEIGCGNGGLLSTLQSACTGGRVVGTDLHLEALRRARRRSSASLVQCDVRRPPFATPFRLIGLFDVLEHLPDDAGALHGIREMLEVGGCLLLTVPAHAWLWSDFDEAARHQRRYSPRLLRERLAGAGFRVAYLSQFMAPLTPIMWLSRRVGRKSPRNFEDQLRIVPGINGAMGAMLAVESMLVARRISLPIGTSLIALAHKDGG